MAIENMQTATPAQIDNVLVNASIEKGISEHRIETTSRSIDYNQEFVDSYTGYIEAAKAQNRLNMIPGLEDSRAKFSAKVATLVSYRDEMEATVKQATNEITACNTEFDRRDGWARYWIVVNSNGHIHTSTYCNTCFPTTQFAWLPDLAGSTHEEVVELAGESACTICFPDAPVDTRNRPSQIEEPAKKAAREEREAAKAERESKKAAKAISNPDGSPLVMDGYKVATEVSAQRECVAVMFNIVLEEQGKHLFNNRSYMEQEAKSLERGLTALAHKRGTDVDTQRALVRKKAEAKVKKEWK